MQAIVKSNSTRKDFIADEILRRKPKMVGIYRLVMNSGSDNWRESSIQGVIERLQANGIEVILYEPMLGQSNYFNTEVVDDLINFKSRSDVIVSNRFDT